MEDLTRLAELIKARNAVTNVIAAQIKRPAQIGHVGEYIASKIFNIRLETSASHKGSDGHFTDGSLACKTVNIKWYAKAEGPLDIVIEASPDYYLVLTGPKAPAASSYGTARPWIIQSAFLFDAHEIVEELRRRDLKIGIASSVKQHLWEEAEIYPTRRNSRLVLSEKQRDLLALFR